MPLPSLYRLAGIVPPDIRRDIMTRTESQTIEHLIESCELSPRITDTDLLECNGAALEWIQSWRDTIS